MGTIVDPGIDPDADEGTATPLRSRPRASAARIGAVALAACLALLLAACAGTGHFRSAQQAAAAMDWDTAVAEYARALKAEPGNELYRLQLIKALHEAAYGHIVKGQAMADAKDYQGAVAEYQKAREYEPSNAYVTPLVAEAEAALAAPPVVKAEEPKEATTGGPELNPLPTTPVKLDFKNANLKDILRALGKCANVNFVFDDSVRDVNYSITLDNVGFEEALTSLMIATHHFYRVIDSSTILIAQDNPMKRRQIEQQQVRTFYISNADLDELRQILQGTIQVKFVAANKSIGAITVRDTPEKLKVVEKLIKANDKSKAEILIELEIVEVNRQRVRQFGLDLGTNAGSQPSAATGAFSPEGSTGGVVRGRDFLTANSLDYAFSLPTVAYKLLLTDSDSKIIANPKLRGVEGKPMSLKMGERVPIPVTTFTPIAGGGANQQPITSFQYENIGINIDITPKIHRNSEITIDLKLEVSSISGTGFGGLPTFGNRLVTATLRLREGESNLLGGLLREEERKFVSGLPGIKSIPVLGKLFSYNDNRKTQTDIVLSLTPHIIRLPEITDADRTPIWVGTEENPSPMGSLLQMRQPPVEGAVEPTAPGRRPPGMRPREEEPQAGPAILDLNPASAQYPLNSHFGVTINLLGVENLKSVSLTLKYDPGILTVRDKDVLEGGFLRSVGGQTAFTRNVNPESGTVTFGIVLGGVAKGVSGSGSLATIGFDPLNPGATVITVGSATFTSATNQPIAVDTSAVVSVLISSEGDKEPPTDK